MPPQALTQWLRLAALIDEIVAVPCRTSDPEAWWPDRKAVDDFAARMALEACSVCAARRACRAYALAADEREGIWGATLRPDRQGAPAAGGRLTVRPAARRGSAVDLGQAGRGRARSRP